MYMVLGYLNLGLFKIYYLFIFQKKGWFQAILTASSL